jgi:hypothetical protein
MAYIENEVLAGVKDGVNKVFTTANPALEIDRILLSSTQLVDYVFTSPDTITLNAAPQVSDPLMCSYWTVGSLINAGVPYEIGSPLSDLLFKVRSLIGEHYSEEWHDRMIADWFNEALNIICTKADFPFMEAESSIYTIPGKEAYQLPAGFKKIIKVYYRGENADAGGQELHYKDSRESSGNGYTLLGGTIIISSPETAKELKIRYYRYLPYYIWDDGTSRSGLPRQYEDMLIDWAVSRAKQQEEIYDVAKIHQDMFSRRFEDMVIDQTRQVSQAWPSIKANINMY